MTAVVLAVLVVVAALYVAGIAAVIWALPGGPLRDRH